MDETQIMARLNDPTALWPLVKRVAAWFALAFLAGSIFDLDGGIALIAVFASDVLIFSPNRWVVQLGYKKKVGELDAENEVLRGHLQQVAEIVEIGNHNAQLAEDRKAKLCELDATVLAMTANASQMDANFGALKAEKEQNEQAFAAWQAEALAKLEKRAATLSALRNEVAAKEAENAILAGQCQALAAETVSQAALHDSQVALCNSQAAKIQSQAHENSLQAAQLDSHKNAYESLLVEEIAMKNRVAKLESECDEYRTKWKTAAARIGAVSRHNKINQEEHAIKTE